MKDELFSDLNDSRFDFSADSLIKDSLLERLMSRQMEAEGRGEGSAGHGAADARVPLSLDALTSAEWGGAKLSPGKASEIASSKASGIASSKASRHEQEPHDPNQGHSR